MKHDLSCRKILVTGATSGIGLDVTKELARRGARIIAVGRNMEALEKLKSENVFPYQLDINDADAYPALMTFVKEKIGGLDIVCFNAGIFQHLSTHKFSTSMVNETMQTNFIAMVRGIEYCLPLLRESQAPHIVGMSSISAFGGLPYGLGAYAASKSSIRHFLSCLRLQLAKEKIAVTTIMPWFVRTPMIDDNSIPMPFVVDSKVAAKKIVKGIENYKYEIYFPKILGLITKGFYWLPFRAQMMFYKLLEKT